MALACAKHHSWQFRASVDVQTEPVNELMASAHVIEYVASAPVTTFLEPPVPVVHSVQVHQVQVVSKTFDTSAPVIKYMAPAPAVLCDEPATMTEYVAPAPDVTLATPDPVIETRHLHTLSP